MVDSPPIASDFPASDDERNQPQAVPVEESSPAPDAAISDTRIARRRPSPLRRVLRPLDTLLMPIRSMFSPSIACAAMAALVLALTIWRVDVVRLLPQTAAFYKLAGMNVNSRGLSIKDVKVKAETVDNKSVLVIEGIIIDEARKPADLPKLRFVVRDEHGTEIYAWNAALEQAVLQPGEKAWFRSRLASPPAEARSIDVRFLSRRDLAAGGA